MPSTTILSISTQIAAGRLIITKDDDDILLDLGHDVSVGPSVRKVDTPNEFVIRSLLVALIRLTCGVAAGQDVGHNFAALIFTLPL